MKVTVEIPDPIYRQVKVRAAQEGRTVRDLTLELYERWLAAAPASDAERADAAEAWLGRWNDLWDRIEQAPKADPRSIVEILADERR